MIWSIYRSLYSYLWLYVLFICFIFLCCLLSCYQIFPWYMNISGLFMDILLSCLVFLLV